MDCLEGQYSVPCLFEKNTYKIQLATKRNSFIKKKKEEEEEELISKKKKRRRGVHAPDNKKGRKEVWIN